MSSRVVGGRVAAYLVNLRGEAVAVNAAVLPESGGANQGVPVAVTRRLLEGRSEGAPEVRLVPSEEIPVPVP